VAIHALEHTEARRRVSVAQPPVFYFVRLFVHAGKRVTFPGRLKYKKTILHNMLRNSSLAYTSTFFRDEPPFFFACFLGSMGALYVITH
jgi:hypothetical protein